MSISESIIAWMKEYSGDIEIEDNVSVDQLEAMGAEIGLFRSPGESVREFIGGSRDVTADFLFIVRRQSQTEDMRAENQRWLEEFERWVRRRNIMQNLPQLSEGRTCYAVRVSNSFAVQLQNDAETTYQIGISIDFFEEV